jgi:hypothetical protein
MEKLQHMSPVWESRVQWGLHKGGGRDSVTLPDRYPGCPGLVKGLCWNMVIWGGEVSRVLFHALYKIGTLFWCMACVLEARVCSACGQVARTVLGGPGHMVSSPGHLSTLKLQHCYKKYMNSTQQLLDFELTFRKDSLEVSSLEPSTPSAESTFFPALLGPFGTWEGVLLTLYRCCSLV